MTEAQQKAIDDLRSDGYVVVIWTPEELGEVDTGNLEDIVIQRGNEFIEDNQ